MLVGFFGLQSSGKGIISTKFLRESYKKNPKKIISNCYINHPHAIIKDSEEIYRYSKNPSMFKNSYLYISEMHNIIDGRRTNSMMNTNFTQFLTQVGKLDCDVIYDAQLFESQIDLRLREFTPLRFRCERYYIDGEKIINALLMPRIIKDYAVAIKIELDISFGDVMKYKKLGYYIPTQEDFDFYKTREVITLDREKFLRK